LIWLEWASNVIMGCLTWLFLRGILEPRY
jgi:hypothetical protein